jgi:large subunit ribosomal protein L6
MSRIGKKPIAVPKGVEVKVDGQNVSIKGPKGTLTRVVHKTVTVAVDGGNVKLSLKDEKSLEDARYFGLSRTLVANMISGVTNGFSKSLTLVGVGYKAAAKGKGVTLNLGHSHAIDFNPPAGIEVKAPTPTSLLVSGPDKELVGRVAAQIRGFRPPEPYHGKGVRYTEERIATKVGKAAGKK